MIDELKSIRNTFVKRVKKNIKGRDFFVGDIHGCFWLLEIALKMVDFDPEKDRVFAVGDLVDRGPESDRCLEFIAKPWFHAVQGNHDDLAIWCALGGREGYLDLGWYVTHGGGWFVGMLDTEKKDYAYELMTLPYLIEIESDLGLIGVVHADTLGDSWPFTVEKFETVTTVEGLERLRGHVLWDRNRHNQRDDTPVEGVHAVIVGHTPVKSAVALGNTFYIDSGACFKNGTLTIIELSDLKDIPQLGPK